jgi:hypothetical protein
MSRYLITAFIGAALSIPSVFSPVPLRADDHKYHDAKHNDDHEWNDREDKAYREWAKENHRKYKEFAKIKVKDQEAYWSWRHDHPDHEEHR